MMTTGNRVTGSCFGHFAGELGVFNENGVESFHAGNLAAGGCPCHIIDLDIAGGIQERRATAAVKSVELVNEMLPPPRSVASAAQ